MSRPDRLARPPRRPLPPGPPSSLRPPPPRRLLIGFVLAGLACASGCTAPRHAAAPESGDGAPSLSSLRRAAAGAANGGNVNVRLVDGVVYVTGRVDSALEEGAIRRALRRIDGVSRVETALQRNM